MHMSCDDHVRAEASNSSQTWELLLHHRIASFGTQVLRKMVIMDMWSVPSWAYLRAVLATKVEESARAMATDRKTNISRSFEQKRS